jgi:hypothetical protein
MIGSHHTSQPILAICWSAAEPERVGQIARLTPGARCLGVEGCARGVPAVRFVMERPGSSIAGPELLARGLSEEPVVVHVAHDRVEVEAIGNWPVLVNGVRLRRGRARQLSGGDTVRVHNRLLLLFTSREELEPLTHFPAANLCAFGDPDAFGMVGESGPVWRLREAIARTARTAGGVLVHGEVGSGKEHVVHGLHGLSSYSQGTCASYVGCDENLKWERIVFGDGTEESEGARRGILGYLDGGTFHLDLAELATPFIVATLTDLARHGGVYRRVGDPTPRRTDFRLIAATSRLSEVDPRLFRLLDALIDVPSLDERREDVPLLVREFVRRHQDTHWGGYLGTNVHGHRYVRLPVDVVDRLVRADFGGVGAWRLGRLLLEEVKAVPREAARPS